ncbi:MFS transporter [Bailinhaonella thermotolerans]|uniref:DHA2 family efflux MFS transporter permease subunit n=1 Tax=Bailinhaonella thermotolerans TaxID=1070861 RepID=A0A3A4B9S2_9ACTN|nr:MFS transporter [Bailinhaonella thermotolerans]RJL30938.1 DHA2 family efflux MFS transporter permease subunit [Bailinhaonella thermotolerans]
MATTLQASRPAGEAQPYRWRWMALAVVLIAEIMDLLDATVTNIAAPAIRAELGGGNSLMQWIGAGYVLAFAVGLVTGGRLGDIYGRRRMFLIGTAGFTLFSVLCGLAPSPELLIVFRALQGAAGAVLIPQGLGIIRDSFPPKELAAAMGAFGPVMGLAAVGGPVLGGYLVDADLFGTGWRMIFLINLPVGLLAFAGGLRFVREARAARRPRLDLMGVALLSATLLLVIYPLVQGHELGWPAWIFALLAASVPMLAIFVRHELRRQRAGLDPLVEMSLFRKRPFTGGLVVGLSFFSIMTGFMFIAGLFFQLGLGFSPLATSVALIPVALGIAIGATVGGALTERVGRRLMHLGALAGVAGLAAQYLTLRQTGADVSAWQLAPSMLVVGVGLGMLMTPFFGIVLAGVSDEEVGSASGLLPAVQQLGTALGLAVLGTVFFELVGDGPAAWSPAGFASATGTVLLVQAGGLALTFALTYLLPRRARADVEHG